jgi:hypothetical protein
MFMSLNKIYRVFFPFYSKRVEMAQDKQEERTIQLVDALAQIPIQSLNGNNRKEYDQFLKYAIKKTRTFNPSSHLYIDYRIKRPRILLMVGKTPKSRGDKKRYRDSSSSSSSSH